MKIIAVLLLALGLSPTAHSQTDYSNPTRDTTMSMTMPQGYDVTLTVHLQADTVIALYKKYGADWRTVLMDRIRQQAGHAWHELNSLFKDARLLLSDDATAAERKALRKSYWQEYTRTWRKADIVNVPNRP